MIEKAGDILDALAGISPQLGRAVPEDAHARRGKTGSDWIPAELTAEGGAAERRACLAK